jgi:hypothetical protein
VTVLHVPNPSVRERLQKPKQSFENFCSSSRRKQPLSPRALQMESRGCRLDNQCRLAQRRTLSIACVSILTWTSLSVMRS